MTGARYARAQRVPLHKARDTVAERLGFPHWNDVTKANKAGWSPTPAQLSDIETLLSDTLPGNLLGLYVDPVRPFFSAGQGAPAKSHQIPGCFRHGIAINELFAIEMIRDRAFVSRCGSAAHE